MPILGNLKIEEAPVQEASTLEVPSAIIGEVTTQPTNSDPENAYMIVVPLQYRNGYGDKTFNAKIYARKEWFTPEFKQQVDTGMIAPTAATSYRISMAKLRQLFQSAGISNGSFDTDQLTGRTVGFRAVPDKRNPQYRVVNRFFEAK